MTEHVRAHTVGDLLRSSVAIYREHFGSFFVAYFVPAFPLALLQEEAQLSERSVLFPVLVLLNLAVAGLASGATTVMVSDACLGRPVSARRAYRSLFRGRVGKVLGTTVLVALALVASLVLLLVPFLFVAPALMLSVPAAVLEDRRPFAAVRRSWLLTRGLRLRNLGVLLLVATVALALAVVVATPFVLLMLDADEQTTTRVMSFVGITLQTLVLPAVLVLQVLMYYDARVRHEGYDGAALSADLHW